MKFRAVSAVLGLTLAVGVSPGRAADTPPGGAQGGVSAASVRAGGELRTAEASLPVDRILVRATIEGYGATVEVHQRFWYRGKDKINATYSYLLPSDATLRWSEARVANGPVVTRLRPRDSKPANPVSQTVEGLIPDAEIGTSVYYVQPLSTRDGRNEWSFPAAGKPFDLMVQLNFSGGSEALKRGEIRSPSHAITVVPNETGAEIKLRDPKAAAKGDFVLQFRNLPRAVKPVKAAASEEGEVLQADPRPGDKMLSPNVRVPGLAPPTALKLDPKSEREELMAETDGNAPDADAVENKLTFLLRDLADKVTDKGKDGTLTVGSIEVTKYLVRVTVTVGEVNDAAREALATLEFKSDESNVTERKITGRIDVRKLYELAKLDLVLRVALAPPPVAEAPPPE